MCNKPYWYCNRLWTHLISSGITLIIGLALATQSLACNVLITWDPSPGPDVAGYIVYYGTQARQYEYEEDCGDVTECELFSLDDQTTYYIAVRAYNWAGEFSDYSDEVVFDGSSDPVANDDSATTDEDTTVTVDVVANDTDADGTVDPTSVAISIWPSRGTAYNNLDGTITYTPDTGFTGQDTFTYTVNDNDGTSSNEATVTVTVVANVPPVANDDSATTDEDTAVTVNVVANDTDTDGTVDPTSVAISIWPSHGTAYNNLDGTITYTPDTGFTGQDTFTYTVNDNDGATSNVATVEITVSDSTYSFLDDFSTDTTWEYTVTHTWTDGGVGQFLYDSVDARAQVLTGDNVGLMFSHDVPVLNSGIFSMDFLPTQKYPSGGILCLRLVQDENNYYEIRNSDGYGPKQIKKVVNGAKVASVFFQSEYIQNNNYHITITFSPDSTTVEAFGDVLTLSGNSDSISVSTFEVRSTQQDAYYDNIFYTDSGANVSPVANDDSATTDEDTTVTVDVVANDTDADGTVDPTSVAISIWPSRGTAYNNLDGTITYTPDTGFTGQDTFTYTVNDNDGTSSNEATVTVTVVANVPPVANDDSATTDEDTAVTVNVVANDTDTDGTVDPTSVAISIWPSHGTAYNNLDGTITYTPDTGFTGQDTFTYTVNDNDGATSNVATVEITVSDSTYSFLDDFSTDTTWEYTVTHTWTDGGVGQFLYDSVDARAQVLTGDNVGLMFSHDVPVLNSGIFSMDFLPTQKYPSGGILCLRLVQDENNYYEIRNSDGYGPKQIKKVVNGAKVASVFFQSEYIQNNNYHITITFSPDSTTVEAFGDVLTLSGNSDSISVSTFEVRSTQQDAYYDNIFYTDSGANVSPVANDDSVTTDEDTTVTVDVVANDTDADGTVDPTSVAISIWPSRGTAYNNLDGTITYTPDTGFTGQDTFTYTVNDNDGATSNVATVEITVSDSTYSFLDDFSTDTTWEYTVTHTWTDGGVGQFLYDSVDARAQVLTGNDVGLMFSHDVPVLNSGIFSMDFLPTQKYPSGGILYLRLVQDQDNYYEITNTDGYGPKQIKKVVNGATVASVFFQSEYTQNNNYHITITFSPDSTTVEAFGDVLTLSGNSDSISVSSFEIESLQQDAYYDNIFYHRFSQ